MIFREATKEDVSKIISMIANDPLGKTRENYRLPIPINYFIAFKNITEDKNQELIVIETKDFEILGTLQLSFIQYLTYQGGIRAQIEGVRIRKDKRGLGIGKKLVQWAINRARERNAHLIQLTTDKQRPKATKFYEHLGFKPSHIGMKMHLEIEKTRRSSR